MDLFSTGDSHCERALGGPCGAPERAGNAEAVAGRNGQKIQYAEFQVATSNLNSNVRQKQRRKDEKQVHDGSGQGDEDIIAAAKATRPDDVCAIDADAPLAYGHLEGGGSQDVTELMQEKTEEQYSSTDDADLEAKGSDFKQEAQGDDHPALLVHAERNHQS